MLVLSGEIRGVSEKQFRDGTKNYLIVEDESLNVFKVGLSEDHVRAGFPSQLNALKGKYCSFSISCGTYQNSLFYRYEGRELPNVRRDVSKATA